LQIGLIPNPSKNTECNYLLAIKIFCEWANKTPEELIIEAKRKYKLVN